MKWILAPKSQKKKKRKKAVSSADKGQEISDLNIISSPWGRNSQGVHRDLTVTDTKKHQKNEFSQWEQNYQYWSGKDACFSIQPVV